MHEPTRSRRAETRAYLASPGGWGTYGSAMEHERYAMPKPDRRLGRRRCDCGEKSTHLGMANGLALTSGCELCMRRWVRDPHYRRRS